MMERIDMALALAEQAHETLVQAANLLRDSLDHDDLTLDAMRLEPETGRLALSLHRRSKAVF
jgi:hypothetical protein